VFPWPYLYGKTIIGSGGGHGHGLRYFRIFFTSGWWIDDGVILCVWYGGKLREKIRPTKIWRETIEREIFSTWKERQRASLVTGNSIDRMIILLLATQHLIINSDR